MKFGTIIYEGHSEVHLEIFKKDEDVELWGYV
jgi:hypothetical protein